MEDLLARVSSTLQMFSFSALNVEELGHQTLSRTHIDDLITYHKKKHEPFIVRRTD